MKSLPPFSLRLWVGLLLLVAIAVSVRASGTITNCSEANLQIALTGGGSVILACDSTITLTRPLLIAKQTVLDATGHTAAIAAGFGTNGTHMIVVQPGVRLTLRNLIISGNTLMPTNTSSAKDGPAAQGAGLFIDHGLVTIDGCTFSNHLAVGGAAHDATVAAGRGGDGGAGAGAAIYNFGGQLLVTNSVFSANTALGGRGGAGAAGLGLGNGSSGGSGGNGGNGAGAAIYNAADGVTTIFDSVFRSNRVVGAAAGAGGAGSGTLGFPGTAGHAAAGAGAAVFNESGTVAVVNSTFTDNNGNAAAGNGGNAGTATFQAGDASNGGPALGGGVFVQAGTVALTNCTFAGNSLLGGTGGAGGIGSTAGFGGSGGKGGNGGDALGGGVYASTSATLLIVNCTFSDNGVVGGTGGAGGQGSGIASSGRSGSTGNAQGGAIYNSGGDVRVRNSILANSTSGGNVGGSLSDEGFNLSSDASAQFSGQGSRNSIEPLLGSFATAGGGLAPTIALSSNSPAINAITAANGNGGPAFDQRNATRHEPYDIGAYEFGGTITPPALQAQSLTGQFIVSWPGSTNFTLQTTTNLLRTNSWSSVTNSVSRLAGTNSLTVAPTDRARFYRLSSPSL